MTGEPEKLLSMSRSFFGKTLSSQSPPCPYHLRKYRIGHERRAMPLSCKKLVVYNHVVEGRPKIFRQRVSRRLVFLTVFLTAFLFIHVEFFAGPRNNLSCDW